MHRTDLGLISIGAERNFNAEQFHRRNLEFEERRRAKIQALQEHREAEDFEECTFTPNHELRSKSQLLHKQWEQRNLDQFLQDQQRKQQERSLRISQISEQVRKKEMDEVKDAPKINTKSKKLAAKKQMQVMQPSASFDVHNRLYDVKDKKNY